MVNVRFDESSGIVALVKVYPLKYIWIEYPEVLPSTFEKVNEPSEAVLADVLVWPFNFNTIDTPLRSVPVLSVTIPDIAYLTGTASMNLLGEVAPFTNWVIWKVPALT